MKTLIKQGAWLYALAATTALVHAQGYIVPDGVAGQSGFVSIFGVIQNPSSGDVTAFAFIAKSANTFQFDKALDEGVRVFSVGLNDPVSLLPILAGNYSEYLVSNIYTFAENDPFYVGLYAGQSVSPYPDPLFGWAKLVNNGGTIQLLDSALEYGGGGIYVGTQNIIPVPEPGTLALAGVGALLIASGWWRKRT